MPAIGREALDVPYRRAGTDAGARRAAPLDMARRCDSTDAGGAIGRVALDAGTVAKPGEPGERSTARRSMRATCRRPSTCPAASCPGRRDRRGGLGSGSITGPIRCRQSARGNRAPCCLASRPPRPVVRRTVPAAAKLSELLTY
jgi:hypothetical protein